jgi:hypothetical protein
LYRTPAKAGRRIIAARLRYDAAPHGVEALLALGERLFGILEELGATCSHRSSRTLGMVSCNFDVIDEMISRASHF